MLWFVENIGLCKIHLIVGPKHRVGHNCVSGIVVVDVVGASGTGATSSARPILHCSLWCLVVS